MSTENLGWNPKRVLFGLSRIGYTPHSAIADIVDNSITYGAKNVHILIRKEREDLSNNRKNNVSEYLVIDDGDGMDKERIISALSLGTDVEYEGDSLSKFGLGLKSASFSQGNVLEVISSAGDKFDKFVVDLNKIKEIYFCENLELNDDDQELIRNYIKGGSGTIIRISDVHKNNHPSLKKTEDELKYRLGTIYFYFIKEGIKIFLNGEEISAYDVLFTDEAEETGNLNEHDWNGRTVSWIKKPTSQTLDISGEEVIKAVVEVTQLPHPPTFSLDGEGEQKKVRDKYKIEASNYGFYVYRNKRLISWAERFDGLIPQDQDFYSFRGRILLGSSGDDAFNIDVKKSHLTLSDEAYNALSDLSDEYKRKSKKAWQHATALRTQLLGQEPNAIANEIAGSIELPEILSGQEIPTPEEERAREEREAEIKAKVKNKIKGEAEQFKGAPVTENELEEFASGGPNEGNKKIFRVQNIEDNLLWEPYYDDDHHWCVRVNKTHRFSRCIFEDNSANMDLQVIFELFLLQAVHAEISMRRSTLYEQDSCEEILLGFRENLSNLLVQMMRNKDLKLPPL